VRSARARGQRSVAEGERVARMGERGGCEKKGGARQW
jgi:hypothetical protein